MKLLENMMQEFYEFCKKTPNYSYGDDIPEHLLEYIMLPGWHDKYEKYLKKCAKKDKKYLYLITFTFDRKKPTFKRGDTEYYNEVRNYIDSLAFSKQYHCKQWLSVMEYHKDESSDVAHYHVMAEFDKSYDTNWFKYYKTKYGSVDKSLSRTGNEEFMIKYLSKDFVPKQII